ncbi:hypothetical protein [Pseudomonas sp. UBA1879]|uniref:hypothetical protein n=1 Tax=Pseudomonas sp. UBA1879 TaxID=1947305 RepID=UPI0025D8F5B0|nr:hypothetical protein [Pseudomonas sp. UBA1879]
MKLRVVDTNVILAANSAHSDISDECMASCITKLYELKANGIVVIDDGYRILREYQHKTDSKKCKGPGDVFLKWLLQNNANAKHCHQVAISEYEEHKFHEFPVPELEKNFDAPDRKFAAVANAHPQKPSILQAADSKWLDWHDDLKQAGINVDFVCRVDVLRFYAKKFPNKPQPNIHE